MRLGHHNLSVWATSNILSFQVQEDLRRLTHWIRRPCEVVTVLKSIPRRWWYVARQKRTSSC